MTEQKESRGEVREFQNRKGIVLEIESSQPNKIYRLEFLQTDYDTFKVRTVSNEGGIYPNIDEPTFEQILEFAEEAMKQLPDSPFTLRLAEQVDEELTLRISRMQQKQKDITHFLDSKIYPTTPMAD